MIDPRDIANASVIELPEALQPLAQARLCAVVALHQDQLGESSSTASGRKTLHALSRVVACSDFIARSLSQSPGLLEEFCSPDGIEEPRRPSELTAIVERIGRKEHDRKTLVQELRRLRRREVARIGWRDLAGLATLEEVVATLSELADAVIETALTCAHDEVATRHGEPIGAESGRPIQMTVLGLGKLGGQELNLSSDVDLIFAYAEPGETDGQQKISNHEFFAKVGQTLIAILEEPTADGIVFRVDMRLRPNGDSGPLALSHDAMDHYYLTHGRDWERYALIKARPVAGDRTGGEQLLEVLRPFVYRKYLDFGAVEAIRSMKELIERQLQHQDMADHIKLGRGGIREIEFIVQSHQLIHGGRSRSLQTSSFWQALTALESLGILERARGEQLHASYDFLRRLEHRLQVLDDQQTHSIPRDPLARQRIAAAMGLESEHDLLSQLGQVTDVVHRNFLDVFRSRQETGAKPDHHLADIWGGELDDDTAADELGALGFREPLRMVRFLDSVRRSRLYQAYSREGRERFDRLLPLALVACAKKADPDATFTRLLSVIESIGRRSAYLSLLAENPLALNQLVHLTTASSWISNWIGQHPVILDELLDPITSFELEGRKSIADDVARKLGEVDRTDLERVMDLLREYRWGYSLRVGAADIVGLLDVTAVSGALCALAEALVEHALRTAYDSLIVSNSAVDTPDLGIIAYGKLGSRELGYNSDLDIIFVYDQPASTTASTAAKQRYHFGRLAQRLVHILTTRTPAGNLYDIDLRLRPSGRSGTVVTTLDAYAQYLHGSAWTWEHQALVRARMICGNDALVQRFEEIRAQTLRRAREPSALAHAITDMRERTITANCRTTTEAFDLKLDRGGLVDIEFLVQYWVLYWAGDHPRLVVHRDNRSIVTELIKLGLLEDHTGRTLLKILERYLAAENRLKLQEQLPLIGHEELVTERNWIKVLWQKQFGLS